MDIQHDQYGVIFVATGQKTSYLAQAEIAARSLKRHMPEISITLFTDSVIEEDCFTQIIPFASCRDPFRDKILAMKASPYRKTLFLDVDTFICKPFYELWQLLDYFDIAVAHAPNRIALREFESIPNALRELPSSYPEFNTGVILISDTPAAKDLLLEWLRIYDLWDCKRFLSKDQPAFRAVCYTHTARIATLPPEYNCRFNMGGYLNLPVKILHGYASQERFEQVDSAFNNRLTEWNSALVFLRENVLVGDIKESF